MSLASPPPAHSPGIAALLARLRAFAQARQISTARVATMVLGNGREIERLEAGGDIGDRKIQRAHAKLDELEAAAAAEVAP
jgi:capsid protein